MKQLFAFSIALLFMAVAGSLYAQDEPVSPSLVGTGVYHGLSVPVKDMPVLTEEEYQQLVLKGEQKALNKKMKERSYPFAETALPRDLDEAWQREMGQIPNSKAPIMNFSGQTSPYYPSDCNGTVGTNYYMQTINCVFAIYNKTTGALVTGPTNMNQLFSGVTGATYNDGDPLVLYDEQAQRWLAVEFSISGSNDYMLVAVSQTSDPTGAWHKYSFDVADMPDYEKFGIWQDGYYMGTNNSSGKDIYVFERSKMLNGQTAQFVGFDNPYRPTTIDGFICVPPVDNDGTFAPTGTPGMFITLVDDAIAGGTDQLWIYSLAVNWTTPTSSTFTRTQQINVTPFDSNFGNNWDNIKQPGTTAELDAIPMVIMNKPQYRNFGTYQTIVCCHTVDVDATDHAGIRWYELRKTTGNWTVRQTGTYAPDAHSRWMGSVALNGNGEIGLGYSISSSTVYPGIRYCGQSAAAYTTGNGTLDIAESVIQNATSSQTSYNRWGDYADISIDPTNDHTFWFTTQYGGSRQTKIASFEFAPVGLTAQFSANPTTVCTGGTVTFTDQSVGGATSWSWSFPGGTPSTSTLQNPVITYSTPGIYSVTLTVGNGTTTDSEVKTNYITCTNINAEFSASTTNVTVGNSVTFTDLTTCNPTSWSWSFPGGTPSSSTSQNPVVTYSTIGVYSVTLTATNATGTDTETKTNYITVSEYQPTYCASQGNNYSYEWIGKVVFGSFVNSSGAAGYSNFTNLTVPLTPGASVAVQLTPTFSSSTYTEYWRVWIDYNKDGDFTDANEQVFTPASSTTVVSGNFTVAAGVTGTTRMRVTMKYNAIPTSCETFSYGEVEDYTVSFGTPQAPVANFSANKTTVAVGGAVQFTDLSTNSPTSWAWTFTGGTPSTSTVQNPSVTYSTAGAYNVSLTATNAAGSDNETKVNYINVISLPGCATAVAPLNGATGVAISSNLEWGAVTNATGYKLYLGTNNPPTNLVNGTNLGNVTLYNPTNDFSYSTVYYWKVVAFNAGGDAVGCSTWSFTTAAQVLPIPGCSTPVSPVDGATNVPIYSNLTWSSATNATGYRIYFGTNNPPTNIANGTDLGNVTTYNPANDLLYNTVYYWKITPYNATGSATGCSQWSFTTMAETTGGVVISYSDFESGFGIWTDGGIDCLLYTGGTYAAGGNNAIDVQDNSGTASSFYHTNGVDVHTPGYVQLKVEFDFIAVSMENNEDFWLQYFTGTSWVTIVKLKYPTDFSNSIFYNATINIFESQYTFPTNMKLRFVNDASTDDDDVYIDNVKITGLTTLTDAENLVIKEIGNKGLESVSANFEGIRIYPNPANNILNINIPGNEKAEIHLYTISGKEVYHEIMLDSQNTIDLTGFPEGLYIISVDTPNEKFIEKLIKR